MNIRKVLAYSGTQPSSGTNTFDIDLGDSSSTYIIQSITISYITIGGTPAPIMVVQAWDGTTANIIWTDSGPVAGQSSYVINRESQVISKKRYIRLSYTGQMSDVFRVCISYFSIPNSNSISSNFLVSAGQTTSGLQTVIENTSPSDVFTIKSVLVSLVTGQPSVDIDVSVSDNSAGTFAEILIGETLDSANPSIGTLSNKTFNVSLEAGDSVSLTQTGTSQLQYYVSYVYDSLDT